MKGLNEIYGDLKDYKMVTQLDAHSSENMQKEINDEGIKQRREVVRVS